MVRLYAPRHTVDNRHTSTSLWKRPVHHPSRARSHCHMNSYYRRHCENGCRYECGRDLLALLVCSTALLVCAPVPALLLRSRLCPRGCGATCAEWWTPQVQQAPQHDGYVRVLHTAFLSSCAAKVCKSVLSAVVAVAIVSANAARSATSIRTRTVESIHSRDRCVRRY